MPARHILTLPTRTVSVDGSDLAEERGRFAVLAFPAGTDAATAPQHEGTLILDATDCRSGRMDLIRHAGDDPASYLVDTDAVCVQLWMLPWGWNEGFETTMSPMLTYFVARGSDLAPLHAVAAAANVAWTGFEVRTVPASSQAPQHDVAFLVERFEHFIRHEAGDYIP